MAVSIDETYQREAMALGSSAVVKRAGMGAALIGASVLTMAAVTSSQASSAPAQHSAAQDRPAGVVTGVVDLISPRLGLVGTGPIDGGPGRAGLELTTNSGRTFTSIGPKTSLNTEPDSIFFLDRDHGWFATFNVVTLAETVYRTADGGRTWRSSAAPGHNDAGGATDQLQFLTSKLGYLTDIWPTAPAEFLYRTTDGGATWHLLARTQFTQSGHRKGLPGLGRVVFQPGGKIGWLGGALFDTAFFRTADGGHTWRKVKLTAPRGALFGLPSVTGRTVTEPVTTERLHGVSIVSASLRVYTSTNDGAAWTLTSMATGAASPACQGPLPTSFPAGSRPWLAAVRGGHVLAYRQAGRRWIGHVTPAPVSRGLCGPDSITGAGTATAWLVTPTRSGNAEQLYGTRDGGRTWRRIGKV